MNDYTLPAAPAAAAPAPANIARATRYLEIWGSRHAAIQSLKLELRKYENAKNNDMAAVIRDMLTALEGMEN